MGPWTPWSVVKTKCATLCLGRSFAMSPIVITYEQLLWASQKACVAPLSMPRAPDAAMQFLLSLCSVVSGEKTFSWAVSHLMFSGIELIEQDSQSILFFSQYRGQSILHYKGRTENSFSRSATRLKGTRLSRSGSWSPFEDQTWQWNRQCIKNWLCYLSIKQKCQFSKSLSAINWGKIFTF